MLLDASPLEDNLNQVDANLLSRIRANLPILSDLSRSDLLLYLATGPQEAIIVDQAQPRSIFPLYAENLVGSRVDANSAPWVFAALSRARVRRGVEKGTVRDAPIVREVLPVLGQDGHAFAALSIEANLLAHERHRRRAKAFRVALQQLQEMALRGELVCEGLLSAFGEHDGLMVVDVDRIIRYQSGIATNLFRRIGYMGNLVHRSVYTLETADAELVDEALNGGACVQRETDEHGRIFIRKAIPLYAHRRRWLMRSARRAEVDVPTPSGAVPVGVMIALHDATSARDKERELKAKAAMIQEVHHRVKNNLQSIASLLRLQARRTETHEVRQALTDTVNRILSVAVVHEFLSYNTGGAINLLDIAQRIASQMSQSVVDPGKSIQFRVNGSPIFLSSQQATACALVVNELLQNALEHGFEQRNAGSINVRLTDEGESAVIEVFDDGAGLPEQFKLGEDSGLGLRIVQTLVEGDLRGKFEIQSDGGARAVVAFPKTLLGGTKS